MTLDIQSIVVNSVLDIGAFSAIGYLSEHVVRLLSQGAKSQFISKLGSNEIKSAVGVCALFIAIDRLVQGILHKLSKNWHLINHPVFSAVRITVSGLSAIGIFNLIALSLDVTQVEIKAAAAVILTAIVIYANIRNYLYHYNYRD